MRISMATLFVFLALGRPPAGAADWPAYRADYQRSGLGAETLRPPLSSAWVYRARHPPSPAWPPPAGQDFWHRAFNLNPTNTYDRAMHPVVADGRLYLASSADDTLRCLDVGDGRVLWRFIAEGPLRLAPAIAEGRVYVASDDGRLYCLDARTGNEIWRRRAAPDDKPDKRLPGNERMISLWPIRAGVVVDRGTVYCAAGLFPTQGVYLVALDAKSGDVEWRRALDISPQGYLLASPTRLFLPTGRTAPVVFDRRDGSPLGALDGMGGGFALALDDMIVRGPSETGALQIDDPASRERIVTVSGERLLAKGPLVYFLQGKRLACLDRERYLGISKEIAAIEKIKKEERTAKQKQQLAELQHERPACRKWETACMDTLELILAGETIFAGGDGRVSALDATNGKALWNAPVEGRALGLAVASGCLFVSTDRGVTHCFAPGSASPAAPPPRAKMEEKDYLSLTYWFRQSQMLAVAEQQGYALVLNADDGALVTGLARNTKMRVIGVESDEKKVVPARRALSRDGILGVRAAIHHGTLADLRYPSHFANLIVSRGIPSCSPEEVIRLQRPYGGVFLIIGAKADLVEKWAAGKIPDLRIEVSDPTSGAAHATAQRNAPLPGAGEWTHAYADPANTACSGDTIVRGPEVDIQWFGRPGPRQMIDRHHRNVPPLYKNGRVIIPGDNIVFAADAYNGILLWEREIPNSRRLGAFLDAGNMALDDDSLFIAAGDVCHVINVRTGEERAAYKMPQPALNGDPREWGFLARQGDFLYGSGSRPGASYTETSREADNALWRSGMSVVTSDYLFALDAAHGRPVWTYHKPKRPGLILNPTITLGGGRLYFLETHSPKALAEKSGRMPIGTLFDGENPYLVALDARSGDLIYKTQVDIREAIEEPVFINYAQERVFISGSRADGKTLRYSLFVHDAPTGGPLWRRDHDSELPAQDDHGQQNRHPTIVGDEIYVWPYAYDLASGKRRDDWKFDRRGHGCGGVSASARALFWRGGNPWMHDLGPEGGPLRLTSVSRPGCWINIIPAGGLILIPESSSGCTCGFSIQTSMALAPANF